ncbi:hypothetical protein [Halomarina oriensis]|uniref:Uncharacterized protein n=1 Tax=Halomarina oriensis TaxID=671145 RepID=A0A6B0GN49_9EURY|nr:hypothetical protein [Halomarina oriensis]MWG36100.1 hypothetical protein [Halomarina oriensis]
MSSSLSLPATVEALEGKAKEHKQAQNTQYHVSVAEHNIHELNGELDELVGSLGELRYYKTVLEDALGGSAPTATIDAVQLAKKAASVTQEELLANVQTGDIGQEEINLNEVSTDSGSRVTVELTEEVETQISQIEAAKRQLKQATNQIKKLIKNGGQNWKGRTEWEEKVRAAEELQSILGSQSKDFNRALNQIRRLLRREMMDSSDSATNFVRQWGRATSNWEKHQSLQSFDAFQEEHNLSDSTVDEIRKLSKSEQLTLADASLNSLKEMKSVSELESAVKLSL